MWALPMRFVTARSSIASLPFTVTASTVTAMGRGDLVVVGERCTHARGDGLLADVKVEESPDLTLLVDTDAALLEMADTGHFRVKGDFLGLGHRGVDRILGIVRRAGGALQGFGVGKDSGLGHGSSFGSIGGDWRGRSSVPSHRLNLP